MERLDTERSEILHHIVAKLLFVCKRARLDIESTIIFICTRATKSTQEDWSKLKRLLCYLKGTLNMLRIIGADSLSIIQSWTDASYVIHAYMKGHTCEVTPFGLGVTHTKYSNTEDEHKTLNRI